MASTQSAQAGHAATLYLWPQRTLYLGLIGHLSPLCHAAHALVLGLDATVRVTVDGEVVEGRAMLVPAGLTYSADFQDEKIACCFLDPLGRDFCFHQSRMHRHPSGVYLNGAREQEQLATLTQLCDTEATANDALAAISGVLFPAPGDAVAGFRADDRIAKVVDLIRQDPGANVSNDWLAEQVGLSGDRLQRLFKDATGVPVRRYRLWHRLFVISNMMAMGSSLTDAALAAGFSDSSHLTNVFRNMLGMSPSTVLRRSRQVR
ncbi:MAG: helix-turn-helix domain-containing protein, partial [Alcanivoracaceae bacterium]